MTLHVYIEEHNKKKLLVALDFDSLKQLDPSFKSFSSKTGIYISEYNNTILGYEHSQLLGEIMCGYFGSLHCKKDQQIWKFFIGIQNAVLNKLNLHLIGE